MFEAGTSTVSCFDELAFLILVSKSAIGSVICIYFTSLRSHKPQAVCLMLRYLMSYTKYLLSYNLLCKSLYLFRIFVSPNFIIYLKINSFSYKKRPILPACFSYARDLTFVSQFSKAYTANTKLSKVSMRSAANLTSCISLC